MCRRKHYAYRKAKLQILPAHIGANLQIRYASEGDILREGLINVLDLNKVVDSVLRAVYDAARKGSNADSQKRSRRMIFTGFDATVSQHIALGRKGTSRGSFNVHIAMHPYPAQAAELCRVL